MSTLSVTTIETGSATTNLSMKTGNSSGPAVTLSSTGGSITISGNSTVNSVIVSSNGEIVVANSTSNTFSVTSVGAVNASSYNIGTFVVANTTVVNATHLAGIAGASYLSSSYAGTLSGNITFSGNSTFSGSNTTVNAVFRVVNSTSNIIFAAANGNIAIGGNVTPAHELRVDGPISLAGAVSDITTLSASGSGQFGNEVVIKGGGAAAEGGQIVLGYGNNLASSITTQSNHTYNIDVTGGNTGSTPLLRIFAQNGDATTTAILNASNTGRIHVGSISEQTDSTFKVTGTANITSTLAVSGVAVPTISSTDTLTNKRITPRVSSATNSTSPFAWNSSNFDQFVLSAQSTTPLTISADSGSPTDGQRVTFRIKPSGITLALTWTTGSTNSFRPVGVTLPTSLTNLKTTYVGCIYNATDSRWDAVAVSTEA